jgi:hypothetical protein
MDRDSGNRFRWQLALLAPLTVGLLALAMYFYDNLQPELGLALLGCSFSAPMAWALLAAREAEYSDSPMGDFIPRMTLWLVVGSGVVGAMHWNVDRRITAMEVGFATLYVVAGIVAMRVLKRRPKRPQLTALHGGNLERRQRRRAR